MLDITGLKNGLLTAIKEVEPWILPNGRKQRRYECVCDCGNKCVVRVNDFRSGKSVSCGCKRKISIHEKRVKDLSGQKFGKLTAICYDHSNKAGKAIWKCICDCGKTCFVAVDCLTSGNTKSCGCYKSETISKRCLNDLTGQTFGHLKVSNIDHRRNKFVYYSCLCDCGTRCVVSGANLRKGKTISCGHIMSKMEDTVNQYLLMNNYEYVYHKTFENLRLINKLEFDFAILHENNVIGLIECQGEQHYVDVGSFGALQRNITDKMKVEYCKSNNIPLYEIRYNEDTIAKLKIILEELHANPVPSLNNEEG